MRGKETGLDAAAVIFRITPAYAGKSDGSGDDANVLTDHPRLCGEKVSVSPHVSEIEGSPPPMRGKATVYHSNIIFTRITPAYAGKSEVYHFLFLRY